jgi:glycosyltransferase involved in cell wall biosynthesis
MTAVATMSAPTPQPATAVIGIVVIGRNEGQRLRDCLSHLPPGANVVYVDSGSTDGSVQMARSLGADVMELDTKIPFTAARARNAGFARLKSIRPDIELAQFVDGDCQIVQGWLEHATQTLIGRPDLAIVCGWRRERFPQQSIYNELCDWEWQAPAGDTTWCGGDFLIRATAFDQVHGFNESIIAGEEPELCVRLRQNRWAIHRLPKTMTLHDAAMSRFGQWWKRTVRTGHAFAEGAAMHGRADGHCVREVRSNWIWGVIIPILALGLAWPTHFWSLSLFGLYPLLAVKIFMGARNRMGFRMAAFFGIFCVIAKFSQMQGQLKYMVTRLLGRRSRLIEYKEPVKC